MKLLFVSEFIDEKPQGATVLAKAHYLSLCKLLGRENVEVFSIKVSGKLSSDDKYQSMSGYTSKRELLCNIISGKPFCMNKAIIDKLIEMIDDFDVIFFDNSYFGSVIKKIKKKNPNKCVISFYHGVYINADMQVLKTGKISFGKILRFYSTVRNEWMTNKYADKQCVLNERDGRVIERVYSRKPDFYLPIYYEDTAELKQYQEMDNEFELLFVGGYFEPNVHGIKWFVENVMPKLNKNIVLNIVGRDMEQLENQQIFNLENVKVIGSVDDLGEWYNRADIVIGPIFKGDGMKTKTAEALMYGKIFLGTAEALCGYNNMEKFHCETAENFIDLITQYYNEGVKKFNIDMRKIYEDNYSVEAANKIWKMILDI